jgi:hypothetical protein
VFRLVLLGVKRLSPDERDTVEQAMAGARASFETLDPAVKERLVELGPPTLQTDTDLAIYTVLEDHGRTSEQRDVIAPMNEELAPGSKVAFEGAVSTLFRDGPADDPGANVSLHFAERVVKADWKAFWSQASDASTM